MSTVSEIRSWFEVPAIAHYCYLFRAAFDLTEFEIEDFEDSLIIDGATEGQETSFLPDLLARLLRGLYKTKEITGKNYQKYLNDLLDYHYTFLEGKKNPVKETEFRKLSCRAKVKILYDICHWRLEVDDIQELLKGKEADSLRIEPVGRNSKGDIFWYFYGTRLYKESFQEATLPVDRNGKYPRKNIKGKFGRSRKKDRKWIESSSDYETGSDWESQDSHFIHEDSVIYSKKTENEDTQWCLECATIDEWTGLVESLKYGKCTDERILLAVLKEQYLDKIAQMIEAKERALQRKLMMESIPRRASGRIALKLMQKEEEERVLEEQRVIEEEQKARETELRRKEVEEQKKKEREKRMKERERASEERRIEREKRLKNREEQKWALENPELAAQFGPVLRNGGETDTDEKETADGSKSNDCQERDDDDELTAMYKVIAALKKHKDSWPFLEPVDESYAPQYYDVIKQPMDLSTIEKKLDNGSYANKIQISRDIKQIFSNCLEYNGPDSPYTKMANNLERAFNKHFAKEFPEEDFASDEDYVEEEDNPKKRKRANILKPSDRGQAKALKLNGGALIGKVSHITELKQTDTIDAKLSFSPSITQFPNGVVTPPVRFSSNAFFNDVLRAPLMQTQLRASSIFQLLNAANGASGVHNQMQNQLQNQVSLGRSISLPTRTSLPMPSPSSSPFLNLVFREQSGSKASLGPESIATVNNQHMIGSLTNQHAIARGMMASSTAGIAQRTPHLSVEQLQALQQSILLQQQLQQRLQLQQQQSGQQMQQQYQLQQLQEQQLQQQQQLQQHQQLQKQQKVQVHQQQQSQVLSKSNAQVKGSQGAESAQKVTSNLQEKQSVQQQLKIESQNQPQSREQQQQQKGNSQKLGDLHQQGNHQQQQHNVNEKSRESDRKEVSACDDTAEQQRQLQNVVQKLALQRYQLQQLQCLKVQQQQPKQHKTSTKQSSEQQHSVYSKVSAPNTSTIQTIKAKISTSTNRKAQQQINSVPREKAENLQTDLTSQKVDELHAIIEDPMSDESRNKRISIEESNQRVRKWLNSESSYFGPPEDDHRERKMESRCVKGEDSVSMPMSKSGNMSILSTQTEVLDQGDVAMNSQGVPPLLNVANPVPGHQGLLDPKIVQQPLNFQQLFTTGARNAESFDAAHGRKGISGQNLRQNKTNAHLLSGSTSFHIENLFSKTPAKLPTSSQSHDNEKALQEHLNLIGKTPKMTENLKRQIQQSHSSSKDSDIVRNSTGSIPQSSPLPGLAIPGQRVTSQARTVADRQASFSGIPPLRVSPSLSHMNPLMSFTPIQHRMPSLNNKRTPTRESPASRGSSMSPQASSYKTDISSLYQIHHDPTKVSLSPSRASPQSGPNEGVFRQEEISIRPRLSMQKPMQQDSKRSNVALTSNTFPPSMQEYLQQQHLSELMRSRFLDNQRLAASNMFSPPQIGSISTQLRPDHRDSKGSNKL